MKVKQSRDEIRKSVVAHCRGVDVLFWKLTESMDQKRVGPVAFLKVLKSKRIKIFKV